MREILSKLSKLSCNLFVVLAISIPAVSAEPAAEAKKSVAELEALRDQIQKIKQEISSSRGESDQLRKQLEQSEADVEAAIKEAKALDEKIQQQNEALETLKKKQAEKSTDLTQQKVFFKQQLRAAYMAPEQNTLKLALNQQDPAAFQRHLVYQQYYSAARSKKITQIGTQLNELQQQQQAISFATNKLRVLKASQQDKLASLEAKKSQRQQLIAQLDQQLSKKGAKLSRMKSDAAALNKLITSLKKTAARLARLAKLEKQKKLAPSFSQAKGKLRWPAAGGIIHRYGTSRNNSSLTWKGVLIGAPVGSDVKVVHDGRVIFSDWFQNLGRLIIVDHGGGYMTLYGHNSELFKTVGEKVETGEVIASVGDTGGRKNSGLYFEVRRKSTPINPGTWCKKPFK